MTAISVVIPVYNVSAYLGACINSVLSQRFEDFELICINDGSTDGSHELLNAFAAKDARVKVFHQENRGLAKTRNRGIELATGEYVFFLDADDVLLNDDVLGILHERATATFADVTSIGVMPFADTSDAMLDAQVNDLLVWFSRRRVGLYCVSLDNVGEAMHFDCVAWGRLFSLAFLLRYRLRFIEANVLHEDNGFWLKVCACLPVFDYVDVPGLGYRIRHGSLISGRLSASGVKSDGQALATVARDAMHYIEHEPRLVGREVIREKLVMSHTYGPCFVEEKSAGFLFRYIWGARRQLLRILGISLYSAKFRDGVLSRRVLGVPLPQRRIH